MHEMVETLNLRSLVGIVFNCFVLVDDISSDAKGSMVIWRTCCMLFFVKKYSKGKLSFYMSSIQGGRSGCWRLLGVLAGYRCIFR